jgi:hypothetical protein
MARLSRHQLEKLRKLAGEPDECQTCRGVQYVGMPGLFVCLYTPRGHGADEEFEKFFWGCPDCGEPVKTVPIVMTGLQYKTRGDGVGRVRPEIPNPWPIHEWPPITQGKPRDEACNERLNRLWGYERT